MVIILLPAVIGAFVAFFRGFEKAFLYVYLPALLLLPQTFIFHIPHIPALNFAEATIIPIFFYFMLTQFFNLKFSLMDFLVLGYLAFCTISQYINEGIGSGASTFTEITTNGFFTYVLTKHLSRSREFLFKFAKMFIILMLFNVAITPYEMRFTVNPYYQILKNFFPGQYMFGVLFEALFNDVCHLDLRRTYK